MISKNATKWGNVLKSKDTFHKFFEESRIWEKQTWLGLPAFKFPFDAWILQEIICETKPGLIIETGTAKGGGALFLASICELIDHGKVVTVDISLPVLEDLVKIKKYPFSRRISFLNGSSISEGIMSKVDDLARNKNCMVILDSWHSKKHVLKEMEIYSKYVGVGSYMVVEDTHMNGNPVEWKWGEGPFEAVMEWMKVNRDTFEIDYSREKFLMTYNPSGFLRRIK